MTPDEVYDILVEHAGAPESDRSSFVAYCAPLSFGHEWRFQGNLGFGGKFYADFRGRNLRVGCYSEDRNEERERIIDLVNDLLDGKRMEL